MQNGHEILRKINALVDELLNVATLLERISSEVTSEEEINDLQAKQEQIITELMHLDDELHNNYPELTEQQAADKENIHAKMAEFQKLNRKFIENLGRGSGIINFE